VYNIANTYRGVRHPSLHCTAAVAMMVNSMQGSCNATAAELLELKGTDGSMEQELGCSHAGMQLSAKNKHAR